MMSTARIITLTTDFGEADGYVGAMRGVILSICPEAFLVNLSHEVPPQDIRAGAFVLYNAVPYYPPETVHCVVVDPGVGSDRRAVAVRTPQGIFVAPDNGVLSLVLADQPVEEAVCLTNPDYQLPQVSSTFHGRDIFAPAAAHLAYGLSPGEFGPKIADLITFPVPRPQVRGDRIIEAHVMHIDHFGNLILDATAEDMPEPRSTFFRLKTTTIDRLSSTFADVADGQPLAYVGSSRDHLEIAVRNGHAAQQLKARVGDTVILEWR